MGELKKAYKVFYRMANLDAVSQKDECTSAFRGFKLNLFGRLTL